MISRLVVAARCSNVLRHPDVSFNESKPLSQLRNRHVPLLRLSLWFLYLLSNFNSMIEREILVKGIQQPEDIFSIAHRNFLACLTYWGLGANDLSSDRLKSEVTVIVATMH
jgi:hypothetical protein